MKSATSTRTNSKPLDTKPFHSRRGVAYGWGDLFFGKGPLCFAPGKDYEQDFNTYREEYEI